MLTITISNTHALVSATLSAVFTDNYPAGLVNAASPAVTTAGCTAGVASATAGAGSVSLPAGTLIPQASTCTVTVVVTSSVSGTLTNTIPSGSLTTSVGTNASTATAAISVSPAVNLSVAKLSNTSTVASGASTTFSFVISNSGPSTASGASFADVLPSQFANATSLGSQASGGASTSSFNISGTTIAGSLTIPSGGAVTITVQVTAVATGSYTNTLNVSVPAGTTNNGQTTSSVIGTVKSAPADISTSFAGFPGSAPVGSVVSGTANFVNTNSTNTATTAVFSLQLPAGLNPANVTVTSAVLGAGSYNPATGQVTFPAAPSLVNVSPSATVSASISFLQTTTGVAGTATGSAVNDTNPLNNTASFSVIESSADMSVTFAGFPPNAPAGSTVTGTISFANINTTPNATATSVTLTLKLSSGLPAGSVTVTSVILGTGTYNSVTGVVTFANVAPNVTPGQTITASVTYKQTLTAVVGTATATASNDTNSSNTTATFSVVSGATVNNATLSGRVFQDALRNKVFDSGIDIPIANFRAELLRVVGSTTVVVGSALTDANGLYTISGLPPGTGYSVRFFDSGGSAIFGTPFNESPVVSGQQVTLLGNPSTGSNTVTGPVVVGQATPLAASIQGITLYAGDNVQEQNLPLDPGGVVYDSITRQPVAGATVKLVYEGVGFNAATQTLGATDTEVTGANGFYQFFFINNPPAGTYRLEVTPPGAYLPPQAIQGGVSLAQPTLVANAGAATVVQPQGTAPAVGVNGTSPIVGFAGGSGTQYFLKFQLNFPGFFEVINNHIPLDPVLGTGALLVTKTGDKTVAEVGDSVQYNVRIRNTTVGSITNIKLNDLLPAGFRYILGTARLGGLALNNPAGGVGRDLTFDIGTIAAQATVDLTYFVRLGVGSQQGDGINQATVVTPVRSNTARFKVTVQGGVFSNEGCIIGKVYVDCDGDAIQGNSGGSRELGIPGVRLVMLDGTFILTDSEGKYSICGMKAQTHVIKVDRTTLPKGSRLVPSSNRNAGVGDSLFVDLKGGELARADFIEGSCSPQVLDQVKARRSQGAVISPEVEKQLPLKIENRSSDAVQQILPETRQQNSMPSGSPGVTR